ncbi:phosphoribosylformylglycinamidine synthase subunit PurS [Lactobacillus sp. S2-2]|uniref:phosphoribosylformylglycinamidine synthase subunit PurS n=1 Tax=Lactobacillus sp. S2-2 TaxID=2692917 RepID=UPI001F45F566|nr:phosphoribosylformylglycinamidine synthase subunit PurS [Lactobacillus sp. S2-2]MCF6515045.1 phosphoribosylformylglycinamidine synthase subunit PurS [Lactobacillus sp. S2-2]
MYLAKVIVTKKASILDPQGETIKNALQNLDFKKIDDVKQGSYFEVKIDADNQEKADQITNSICKELLVNQNMESYKFSLEEV